MPIQFFTSDGATKVKQSFGSPTIYLDHWALRLFSDDSDLQDRLVGTLIRQRGTLLQSNLSFAEFAREDDRRHAVAAEAFIERLLPNIYFSDFALDEADALERQESDNVRRFWPSADLAQLKFFGEHAQDASLGFVMRGFISMARDNYAALEPIVRETLQKVRVGLEEFRTNSEYVQAARTTKPTLKRTRTCVIMGELMREFILDSRLKLSDNDVMDMLHTAMSVNCCDFVLIDGAWTDRVSKMNQRVAKVGGIMPVARCYSRRDNGVLRFLADLDSYKLGLQ